MRNAQRAVKAGHLAHACMTGCLGKAHHGRPHADFAHLPTLPSAAAQACRVHRPPLSITPPNWQWRNSGMARQSDTMYDRLRTCAWRARICWITTSEMSVCTQRWGRRTRWYIHARAARTMQACTTMRVAGWGVAHSSTAAACGAHQEASFPGACRRAAPVGYGGVHACVHEPMQPMCATPGMYIYI